MSECQTKAGNQNSHSLTHSLSHSLNLDMLNNFCFHVYAQKSHSHSLSLSHSLTPYMMNHFGFHVSFQSSQSRIPAKRMSEIRQKLTLSHSFSLSFTHSRHNEQLLFSCLCSKVTLSISLSHSLLVGLFLAKQVHPTNKFSQSGCSQPGKYTRKKTFSCRVVNSS